MKAVAWRGPLALAFVSVLGFPLAQCLASDSAPNGEKASEPWWRANLKLTLQDRIRGEGVSWFQPKPDPSKGISRGAGDYGFFANQIRFGAQLKLPHLTAVIEGQDVRLVGLPKDASLPAPFGNLGPGALYFAHSPGVRRDQTDLGETTLRQGYFTLSDPPGVSGLSLTLGRFEYSDGLETPSKDPTLTWLKRFRIAERLIGPFNYTHIGRSFDGLRLVYEQPNYNFTGIAVRPTHGGFEISSSRQIHDIDLVGATLTLKQPEGPAPTEARFFYFHYEDSRFEAAGEGVTPLPVRVDNRPAPVRAADGEPIQIDTLGTHAVSTFEWDALRFDLLYWGAVQTGSWGEQSHFAWSWTLEGGAQLPKVFAKPWLRVGYGQSSGDDDPEDGRHETFFEILPTVRVYAQTPFFAQMNLHDLFAQIVLRPHPKVTVRSDWHWLQLDQPSDLWYAGAGATNNNVFGYSGLPSGNRRDLAHLVDLSVNVALTDFLTIYGYYGHVFGQEVVKNTFLGENADYGYLEATFRY
jgi:Alginate export